MVSKTLFSSKTGEWSTPQWLIELVKKEFEIGFDAAASKQNAKCDRYFTQEDDALSRPWPNETPIWLNPPFGRNIECWLKKAFEESVSQRVRVVVLVPLRADTRWFREWCLRASLILILPGRLKFGSSKNPAPFGTALVVFDPDFVKPPQFSMVLGAQVGFVPIGLVLSPFGKGNSGELFPLGV